MGETQGKSLSAHLFEIRYKPSAKILDKRGEWADVLATEMGFSHWNIGPNRIDINDEDGHSCFVSFRNAGYAARDAIHSTFQDNAVKFFKAVLQLDDFPKPLSVERIGVRQKYLSPFDGAFEELVERFTKHYIRLTDQAVEAIGGKLIDIGAPLNFADRHGNFNTQAGPVAKEQGKQLMEGREDLPAIGFYYDIDYWLKKPGEMKDGQILQVIKDFAVEGSARHDRIRKLIIGI
jgi:hypothetical protein